MSLKSLFKTIIKTSSITSMGISSLIAFTSPSKAENFNMKACPEPGTPNANLTYIENTLGGECLHTPDHILHYQWHTRSLYTSMAETNRDVQCVKMTLV